MNRLAIPATLAVALLSTACAETEQVCRTYGNKTTCRTERVKSRAERERSLDNAIFTIDWMNCVELGQGSREVCKARARRAQK